jgi:hypothetical protein
VLHRIAAKAQMRGLEITNLNTANVDTNLTAGANFRRIPVVSPQCGRV